MMRASSHLAPRASPAALRPRRLRICTHTNPHSLTTHTDTIHYGKPDLPEFASLHTDSKILLLLFQYVTSLLRFYYVSPRSSLFRLIGHRILDDLLSETKYYLY